MSELQVADAATRPSGSEAEPLMRRPQALLLDFGGVIISTAKRPAGRREFAQQLHTRLAQARVQVPAEELEACLAAGSLALKHWKHASSRRLQPRELSVEEILGDFYFADLPQQARALLVGDGAELLDQMATALTDHIIRPGVEELIQYAADHGIATGIVSNAHSGRSHRRILAGLGLQDSFGVQIYSDEAGIRKPHPHMLLRAAEALGAAPQDCWYVGDTLDRDLVAGRRAGAGAVVLTRSQHTDEPPFLIRDVPEAIVEDPAELLQLLRRAVEGSAEPAGQRGAANGTVPLTLSSSTSGSNGTSAAQGQGDSLRRGQLQADQGAGAAAGAPVRAVLLDHGGVISSTLKPASPFAEAADAVETALRRAGCPVAPGEGLEIVQAAHRAYGAYKKSEEHQESFREITARTYWGEFTSERTTDRQRAVLLSEAETLQQALYRSKSVKTERAGIRELLQHCRQADIPVVIVSNTVCGTGVRSVLRGYGFESFISGWVCSDEFGWKKPHPEIFRRALTMAGVSPQEAAMVGDKPYNDAFGAQQAGIATRIITRGGSGTESQIAAGLQSGWITHVVDTPGQIPALLGTP
ncbi:HAD-IA family hydrolase [Nesterenkonia sp.]|uniref:HAD family hydrolase n=1 Tax=Nesterenkonia sp. TaxID=704201 RepID=UPI00261A5436|nr:HAD-IA family hydrolase [Nesterenkonia sp.]